MIVLSAALVAYAVLRLRAEATRATASRVSRLASWLGTAECSALMVASRPVAGQRSGPLARVASRPALAIGGDRLGSFIALSIAGMAAGIVTIVDDYDDGSEFLMLVSGFTRLLACFWSACSARRCSPKNGSGAALTC